MAKTSLLGVPYCSKKKLISFSFLAQHMICQLKLSLCDNLLSTVPLSVSLNIGCTNLDSITDLQGAYVVCRNLELGQSNLPCGFSRAKFTFSIYSNGNKVCLHLMAFDNNILFNMPNDCPNQDLCTI